MRLRGGGGLRLLAILLLLVGSMLVCISARGCMCVSDIEKASLWFYGNGYWLNNGVRCSC